MKLLACLSSMVFASVISGSAAAQVTQSYTYDGNGRLVGVSTVGSAGTNTAAYAYDDADNRTSRSQTGSTAYAAISRLPLDHPLMPREALVSDDGQYTLAVRSSGDVELWRGDVHQTRPDLKHLFSVDAVGAAWFWRPAVASATDASVLTLANDGRLFLTSTGERGPASEAVELANVEVAR